MAHGNDQFRFSIEILIESCVDRVCGLRDLFDRRSVIAFFREAMDGSTFQRQHNASMMPIAALNLYMYSGQQECAARPLGANGVRG